MKELTDSSGRQIRLVKPLGKGGFGSVWLAEVRDPSGLVHRMAVKLLHEALAQDADLAARARDEARLMSQLSHDHEVKVHALTEIDGRAAVLMEYVEGIDCTALLADCRQRGEPGLPLTIAAAIVERSASALHAAWTNTSPQTGLPLRVVHRDIKPANLLLSVLGVVKVMDFGVARADFEREAETQSVQFGTQRYMAPERWLLGKAGPASDVYSLGVTLWELLSGTRFERLPLAEPAYVDKLASQVAQLRIHTPLDPAAADRVEGILLGMTAFDPEARLTAAQVEDQLGALLEHARGPDLRRWARQRVPELLRARLASLSQDRVVGELSGTLAMAEVEVSETPSPKRLTVEETSMDLLAEAPSTPALDPPAPVAQPSRRGLFAGVGLGLALVLGLGGWFASALVGSGEPALEVTLEPPGELGQPAVAEEPAVPVEPGEHQVQAEEPALGARPEARPSPRSRPVEAEPEPVEPKAVEAEPELAEAEVAAPAPSPVVRDRGPALQTVKILARPIDGSTHVLDRTVPVQGTVDLPVGETVRLKHTWDDAQTLTCEKLISADTTRVFFDRDSRKCSY